VDKNEVKSAIRKRIEQFSFVTDKTISDEWDFDINSDDFEKVIDSLIKLKVIDQDIWEINFDDGSGSMKIFFARGVDRDKLLKPISQYISFTKK